ncbi:glutaredoxin domain-containing cysteine-rich protein CG12206-like [Sitodiplosis mosellana]|uniref:glutaredoxin domain-containing cysteine-rich protein CG12206-like n=1 Tax=Sitodiplosis mosellana TaxID=263140 RepID=UPI0024438770|nr:glutaredoxin domain-containing cysteine-rich protein CG12206-like [Sitodiplosis mosellana]
MVQKVNSEVEVNTKPAYMYYLMSKSGQCSPTSDTLDSGTGSDLETTPTTNGNSYTLPTSLTLTNAVSKSMRKFGDLSLDGSPRRLKSNHSSNDSYNTDSEESESSLSCDSLNSSEIMRMKTNTTNIIRAMPFGSSVSTDSCPEPTEGTIITSDENNVTKINFLPRSLLRDIRDRSMTIGKNQSHAVAFSHLNSNGHSSHSSNSSNNGNSDTDESNDAYRNDSSKTIIVNSHLKKKECNNTSASYTNEPFNLHHRRDTINNDFDHLFATNGKSIDPLRRVMQNMNSNNTGNNKMKSENKRHIYENDKYISFHLNERADNAMSHERDTFNRTKDDDSFAGYRDITASNVASTIRSSKGTIRGVKNRVRNGIATFLQMHQTNVKNFKEKDAGKVVLYSTSMGIVRETYAKCANVKQILRTLLVKFEERDIFMSNEYQQEIKDRMQSMEIQVPQLYVDGQYIGDADHVERLNESGELRQLLKMYKTSNSAQTCQICGGYRLMPCPSCSGSKKSVHRNHFTTEFVALKCMNCDEVGLVKCYNCND